MNHAPRDLTMVAFFFFDGLEIIAYAYYNYIAYDKYQPYRMNFI